MIVNYLLGANPQRGGKCLFSVWAPLAESIEVEIVTQGNKRIAASEMMYGYWKAEVDHVIVGDQYFYVLNGNEKFPDPASRYQPEGVHGPSEIIDPERFPWTDVGWKSIPLQKMIQYELHVGTFSPTEDFNGIIEKLPYLKDLGINTIELLPVAQFPGHRNWGYDGVYPFAVQWSYGGPAGLAKLVDTCHRNGFAVILDVVYNHLGPEGNYFGKYGPYFSGKYKTAWGQAINFDDRYADGMINYVIQNVRYWLWDLHLDGLRLDAVHAIYDFSAKHIMQQLSEQVDEITRTTGRNYLLIAESNLNDIRYLNSREKGGYGLHAQWSDDFHHTVHTCITGERSSYYMDYGSIEDLAKAIKNTFVLDGVYSIFRKRTFGNDPRELDGSQFVIFIQNHDQVGNRKKGERLGHLVSQDMLKVAAGILFLTPNVPMLFMGEEFNAQTPFLYFVNHNDEQLNKLVREGREKEFEDLNHGDADPAPFPDLENTFIRSKLNWSELANPAQREMLEYYKMLILLKKTHPALISTNREDCSVQGNEKEQTLIIRRWKDDNRLLAFINLNQMPVKMEYVTEPTERFSLLVNSGRGDDAGDRLPEIISGKTCLTLPKETLLIYSSSADDPTTHGNTYLDLNETILKDKI